MEIRPFVVDVPQSLLDDLQERLARTRWPDEVEDAGWDYGTNLAYLQALMAYWQMHLPCHVLPAGFSPLTVTRQNSESTTIR